MSIVALTPSDKDLEQWLDNSCEIDEKFSKRSDLWSRSKSSDEGAALINYIHHVHEDVNNLLRDSETPMTDQNKKAAFETIFGLMKDMRPIREPVIVMRGMAEDFLSKDTGGLMKVGENFTEDTFTSSSVLLERAATFAKNENFSKTHVFHTFIEIKIPSSAKAIIVSSDEDEIILPPGTKFKVIGYRKNAKMPGSEKGVKIAVKHLYSLEVALP